MKDSTESVVKIQDEDSDDEVSIVECLDDITKNGIVVVNADWSNIWSD